MDDANVRTIATRLLREDADLKAAVLNGTVSVKLLRSKCAQSLLSSTSPEAAEQLKTFKAIFQECLAAASKRKRDEQRDNIGHTNNVDATVARAMRSQLAEQAAAWREHLAEAGALEAARALAYYDAQLYAGLVRGRAPPPPRN